MSKDWKASKLFEYKFITKYLRITVCMNSGDGVMGRLGGGWLWKLSILVARTEIVFEIIFFSIRISWGKTKAYGHF